MANTADQVLAVAEAEVGYLEKKSAADLYDKTANAGSANYTKYGKEMHELYPSVMDYPAAWCDAFVDWCFYKAYGVTNAKGLLGGDFNDYTVASAQLYKNKGAWHTSGPKAGDQIFFKNSSRINHTGLVYKVSGSKVYTIEGNTSGASGVVANGGGVCRKSYALTNSRIAGYGRPAYDAEPAAPAKGTGGMTTIREIQSWAGTTADGIYGPKTKKAIVKKAQAAIGTAADGIWGTKSRACWKNLKKGSTGEAVRAMQAMLICRGYSCGGCGADGDFGADTDAAVRKYQSDNRLTLDGIAGKVTSARLFG